MGCPAPGSTRRIIGGTGLIISVFAFVPVPAPAQSPANTASGTGTSSEVPFDFGAAPDSGTRADGVLEAGEAAFSGNPARSAMGWWPDNLVAAPVPGYSPQLGWQLSVVAGYFMALDRRDERTAPSLAGIVAMGSENGSRAAGAGGKFYLSGDRIRVRAGVANIDVNYRYYGSGEQDLVADIAQSMTFGYAAAMHRVSGNLYVGLGLLGSDVETGLRVDAALPPGLPDPRLRTDLRALELPLEYDSRDDNLFPTTGWYVGASAVFHRPSLGSDVDANVLSLEANHYRPIREGDVLALRAYYRTVVGDDLPFFMLSSFGGKKDLRGYESGRYRDEMMYAVQAEYRWRPNERWVFTGFAGFGHVAAAFDDLFDDYLAAAGVGARFMVSPEHNFSVSVDWAVGDGDQQFYFGVGEAF